MRRNPGIGVLLRGLGVDTTKGSVAELNQLVDKLGTMGAPGTAGYAVATQYASMFGIDERTLFMLEKSRDENKKTQALYATWLKQMGLTSDDIDKITRSNHEFMDSLRDLKAHFELLLTVEEGRLIPAGKQIVTWLQDFVTWAGRADKSTQGLIAVLSTLGATATAKIGLGLVGRGLGIGGGAALAEGEGAAAAAGPVGWVVGIGAAVAAGLVWMQMHPEQVRAAVKGSWGWIKTESGNEAKELGSGLAAGKSLVHSTGLAKALPLLLAVGGFGGEADALAKLEKFVGSKEISARTPTGMWTIIR